MTDTPTAQTDWHAIHAARAARLEREERMNCLTHALGALAGVVGMVYLLTVTAQRGDGWQMLACAIYASALVAVFVASALSHAFHQSRWRRLFRMIDQACIFLLIAGTFTPIATTYLRQGAWWILLAAMWAVALVGFASKAFFAHRVESVSTKLHLVLGWMPVLAAKPIILLAPAGLGVWMLAGGCCYSLGTIWLHNDHRPYFHVVWHLLVIAGSACHFLAIWAYCTIAPL